VRDALANFTLLQTLRQSLLQAPLSPAPHQPRSVCAVHILSVSTRTRRQLTSVRDVAPAEQTKPASQLARSPLNLPGLLMRMERYNHLHREVYPSYIANDLCKRQPQRVASFNYNLSPAVLRKHFFLACDEKTTGFRSVLMLFSRYRRHTRRNGERALSLPGPVKKPRRKRLTQLPKNSAGQRSPFPQKPNSGDRDREVGREVVNCGFTHRNDVNRPPVVENPAAALQ